MSDQLLLIHAKQEAKYGATVQSLRSYLRSLAATRLDGIVTSDDACAYLDQHGVTADKRLVGAVFRSGFRQVGYCRSTRRRGMHATWVPVPKADS